MNIYDITSKSTGQEHVDTLLQKDGMRIERIISTGETTGWYDQSEDEWIVLVEGEAELEIAEENSLRKIRLNRGDSLFVPARQKHRVSHISTDPACIWLCVFL